MTLRSAPEVLRLTCGIPTYNRAESVLAQVRALRAATLPDWLEVVIIDDASQDGSFDALSEACAGSAIRVLRNGHNLGYAGNLLRLFEEARAPYLLVSSDDDRLMLEQLGPLVELLDERAPALVSPQFLIGGELVRGRARTGEIEPADCFAASAHAPGLVYRLSAAREGLDELRTLLAAASDAALIYPQVVLAGRMLLTGSGLWWDRPVVAVGEQLPSGLSDASGQRYATLGSRWRQAQGFVDLYTQRLAECSDPVARQRAAAMLSHEQSRLFAFLRFGLAAERADLLPAFDAGARRFAGRRKLSFWAGRLLRSPRSTVAALARGLRR
jgi:glycosyltransferase involved in cell wall biosynthesis